MAPGAAQAWGPPSQETSTWGNPQPPVYSAPIDLNSRLRIQARQGYRAGVIELRPGLFLVAEVPDAPSQLEFGGALLAPLALNLAAAAIQNPYQTQQVLSSAAENGRQLLQLPWASQEEVGAYIGCEGVASCRCRQGRYGR
jgi:hypothetical protein